jgi:hypothetical protein
MNNGGFWTQSCWTSSFHYNSVTQLVSQSFGFSNYLTITRPRTEDPQMVGMTPLETSHSVPTVAFSSASLRPISTSQLALSRGYHYQNSYEQNCHRAGGKYMEVRSNYGLEDRQIGIRYPAGTRNVSVLHRVRTQPSITWVLGGYSDRGVKQTTHPI